MRVIFLLIQVAACVAVECSAEADFWNSDLDLAMEDAASEEKAVLLYFTGSDWCHWCRKLDNELFADTPYRKRLLDSVIPVLLDFPRGRSIAPGTLRKNRIEKHKWSVDTFPTVILFDPKSGEELWRHSYMSVELEEYLEAVEIALDS
tara:strand:+ start:1458 stop:1901 length:444 start_codon:yes stop_codon:yes gene_type:complete